VSLLSGASSGTGGGVEEGGSGEVSWRLWKEKKGGSSAPSLIPDEGTRLALHVKGRGRRGPTDPYRKKEGGGGDCSISSHVTVHHQGKGRGKGRRPLSLPVSRSWEERKSDSQ